MTAIDEHAAAIAALLQPLADREPELWRAALPPTGGVPRVLARDIPNSIDLPPFDNSQMDGYAVRAADIVPGGALRVGPRIAAGHAVGRLALGEAAPIMTGAPIPDGADAVIPIEDASPDRFQSAEDEHTVSFANPVTSGTFIRRRGSDLVAGSLLLPAGTTLGPAQWGVLAASGVSPVPLLGRLRVLIVSTGDELMTGGGPLGAGRIHDSNGASMAVAVAGAGAEVVDVLVIQDEPRRLREAVLDRADQLDLILTTGGVSMGAYEVVRDVFEPAGVTFVTIPMQPGGPQGFGMAVLGGVSVPVIAFPGNPVSALVSFEMFLRPTLRRLHGLQANRRSWSAPLSRAAESPTGRHQVRRGRILADGTVELVGGAGSHLLHGYAASTVLVHVPIGVGQLDAGTPVEVWSIDD